MIKHRQNKAALQANLKAALEANPDNITNRCDKIGRILEVSNVTVRNYITGASCNDGYLGEAVLEMWRVVK